MDYVKKQSENGYDLITRNRLYWDLADSETWSYLGVPEDPAMWIVKGFPIYHQESGNALREGKHEETLASEQRIACLPLLASNKHLQSATNDDNPFTELYRYRQDVAMGGPFYDVDNSLAGTKLAWEQERRRREHFEQHADALEVPLQQWVEAVRDLFDQLEQQPRERLNPAFLQRRRKQRQQTGNRHAAGYGLKLLSQEDLESLHGYAADQPVQWGPLFYPLEMVNRTHFCAVGATRTGKTSILRLLFQSLHRKLGDRSHFVLYDAKCELLPYLYPPEFLAEEPTQEQLDSAFYILNPFDARSTPWDIARDADDDAMAMGIAEALFPDVDAKDEAYFGPAVRDLAIAAMKSLRDRAGGPYWTFCQFVCSLLPENLKAVLDATDWGRGVYEDYLGKLTESSDATRKALRARYSTLVGPAFAWEQSTRPALSLRDWVPEDPKSIVLMSVDLYGEGLDRLNRLLLGVLCRNLSVIRSRMQTYLYLDEFENLKYVEWIVKLAKQGASKGIHLALCMHDINALRKVYGLDTEGLISNCGFWAFLQTNDPVTTDWASSVIGKPEQERTSHTQHHGDDESSKGKSSTTSFRQRDPLVAAAELQGLPTPLTCDEITAYFADPRHTRYRGELPLAELDPDRETARHNPHALWPKCKRVAEFVPLPVPPSIPNDTFYPLYQLGFRREGYTPPEDTVESGQPPESGLDERQNKTHTAVEVTVRQDVRFHFPLDD